MTDSADDAGTIQTMLDRLNKWRLPRALEIKKKVDGGATLDGNDLEFLKRVFEDAGLAQSLVGKHPELKQLVGKLIGLYNDITKKGLENEQQQK